MVLIGPFRLDQHYTASMAKAIVGGLSIAVAQTDRRLALDDNASKLTCRSGHPIRASPASRFVSAGFAHLGAGRAEADKLPHDKLNLKGDFWKRLEPPNDPFTIARDRTPAPSSLGRSFSISNPGIAMLTYALTSALRNGSTRRPHVVAGSRHATGRCARR